MRNAEFIVIGSFTWCPREKSNLRPPDYKSTSGAASQLPKFQMVRSSELRTLSTISERPRDTFPYGFPAERFLS
jgi:hypothetical protein